MKKARIVPWLVVGLLPLVFCGVGWLAAGYLESGATREWQELGRPPGGAVEILDADGSAAYVANSQGQIYLCPDCQKMLPLPDPPLYDPDFQCRSSAQPPVPPGEVLDRFEGSQCFADGGTDYVYLALEDGSVWVWNYTGSVYGLLAYPLFAVVGCLVGLVVAGIAAIILKIRQSQLVQPEV